MRALNKYRLEKEKRVCNSCKRGADNRERFASECEITKNRSKDPGRNEEIRIRNIWEGELNQKEGKKIPKDSWEENVKIKKGKEWRMNSQGRDVEQDKTENEEMK